MKEVKEKPFWVVTALVFSSSNSIGDRARYASEKEAIDAATTNAVTRSQKGLSPLPQYVLKVVARVAPEQAPVKITKYK